MSRTLVAVHAHPDDETITMGGTLARYSAEGVRTVVVTCTRGDLGEVLDNSLVGQDVGTIRDRELHAAVESLGVSRLVQLGYLDSGMAGEPANFRPGAFHGADVSEAAARLLAVIAEEQPQILVTYDETGGYGHPDHIMAHQVAVAAFRSCSAEVRPKRLYFVRYPLGWTREFVRALRDEGIDAPPSAATGADAGPDVHEIGVPDDLVTTVVDVRAYIDCKLAAVACYPSQWPPEHFIRRMPRNLAERLWAAEYYSRADGVAPSRKETDLFAGLD